MTAKLDVLDHIVTNEVSPRVSQSRRIKTPNHLDTPHMRDLENRLAAIDGEIRIYADAWQWDEMPTNRLLA